MTSESFGAPNQRAEGWAIDARGLSKTYGDSVALRGVDLRVDWGDRLAIFGPNGAGKTTLIKVLGTVARPASGEAAVAGFDVREYSVEVRRRIGVVSHETLLYGELSARENLEFYGRMHSVPDLADRITRLLSEVGMQARMHEPVRALSRGMQQRVAIARALVHDPPVLLMDEPATGLDQEANDLLARVVGSTAGPRRTVVLATHALEQGLALCNRVAILVAGRVAYEGGNELNVEALRELYLQHTGAKR